MQPHGKDKKITKSRKWSLRRAHEALLSTLPREDAREDGGAVEEARNKLEMSNLQLFFWKSQGVRETYPSAFQLIRLSSIDPADVTLHHLLQPSFPVLSFRVRELVSFACLMMEGNSFARGLPRLKDLFSVIAQHYNCVSYHNFSHAFNLMLINFQCIDRDPALAALFSHEERFCIAVAALSHDLGHNGTNNHFEVQRGSELARLSNNEAVLEHMHVRTLWKILDEQPQLNFLPLLADQPAARKAITGLILNTDMAAHTAGHARLRALHTLPLADHKWTLMEELFHACDIGNPCLDYDNYMSWAALLAFEFDAQTRTEEKLDLVVSRELVYRGMGSFYSGQEWFLGSIVQPLWKEIADLRPNLLPFCTNIERNLERIREETRTCCQE